MTSAANLPAGMQLALYASPLAFAIAAWLMWCRERRER